MFTTPMLFQTIYIYIYIFLEKQTHTYKEEGNGKNIALMQEPVHSLRGKVDGQTY